MNDKNNNVQFKWIASITVALIIAIAGAIMSDTRATVDRIGNKVDTMQKEKVDWEQYRCDIADIKHDLKILVNLQHTKKEKALEGK